MKRTKIISLLLIVVLVLSCTACGNTPSGAENNTTPTLAPTEQTEPATPTPVPATPTPTNSPAADGWQPTLSPPNIAALVHSINLVCRTLSK